MAISAGDVGSGGGVLAGTAYVNIRPDLSTFGPRLKTEIRGVLGSLGGFKLDALDKSFAGLGASASKLGGLLSKNLTAPLLGAGAVAFKFGADFDAVLARMQGLAGVSADEIDGIRASLLKLSGETGRAPTELANALYLVRSAGLEGQQALDAVTLAAKSSAAGMGDTETIAGALVSTLNAYAKSGLTATRASDILTAAVRVGSAEADAFAGVLGNVVPLAAQLGVGFDQVAASIAVMTKAGVDTDTAATNLRQMFASLLEASNPASQAAKTLATVGLTAQGLRDDLAKPEGVLVVLKELTDAFGNNDEALQQIFPNIRALSGVLALMAQSPKEVAKAFDQVTESVGSTAFAFTKAQETAEFKLQRALADAKVALISFGEAAAPVGSKIADFGAASFSAFSKLPDGVKTGTVAIGGLVAAAGPLLFLGGKLSSGLGKVASTVKGAGDRLIDFRLGLAGVTEAGASFSNKLGGIGAALGPAGVAGALGAVTVALGFAGVALDKYLATKEEARQRVVAFTDALRADSGAIGENTRAYVINQLQQRQQLDDLGRVTPALRSHRSAIDVYTDALTGNVAAQQEFRRALIDSGEIRLVGPQKAIDEFIRSGTEFSEKGRVIITGNKALVHEFDNLVGAAGQSRDALRGVSDATRTSADVDRDLAAAKQKLLDLAASGVASDRDLATAHERVSDLEAERARIDKVLGGSIDTVTTSTKKQVTTLEQLIDRNEFLRNLNDEIRGSVDAVDQAQRALNDARADAAGTGPNAIAAAQREQEAMRSLAQATQGVTDAQDKLHDAREKLAELDSGPSKTIATLERTQIIDRVVTTPEEARQKEIDLLKFDQDAADKRESLQGQVADAERSVEDAAQRVADAQRGVADAAQNRRQVQVEAARQVEVAERNVNAAVDDTIGKIRALGTDGAAALDPWLGALLQIEGILSPDSPLRQNLGALIADLSKFAPPAPPTEAPVGHGGVKRYAIGGSAQEGWSVVGEAGAELLHKQGSQVDIFSHTKSQQMLAPAAASERPNTHISVSAPITVSDSNVANQVEVEMRKLGMRLAAVVR